METTAKFFSAILERMADFEHTWLILNLPTINKHTVVWALQPANSISDLKLPIVPKKWSPYKDRGAPICSEKSPREYQPRPFSCQPRKPPYAQHPVPKPAYRTYSNKTHDPI